jgi:hypothetical protein
MKDHTTISWASWSKTDGFASGDEVIWYEDVKDFVRMPDAARCEEIRQEWEGYWAARRFVGLR